MLLEIAIKTELQNLNILTETELVDFRSRCLLIYFFDFLQKVSFRRVSF